MYVRSQVTSQDTVLINFLLIVYIYKPGQKSNSITKTVL